jgi:hypothetical protein
LRIGKGSKWLSLFVITATLASALLMQVGMASAATLQPFISPAGGSFTTAQSVSVYNIANGDTAYYTTDGSSPVNSGTHITYTGPFTVSQSETVQAVAYDSTTGWSATTSAAFIINGSGSLQTPAISPDGGSFTTAQTVTISGSYGWGTVYYTTDGSNPVTSNTRIAYRWPFTIDQSETIEAANYNSTGWSGVASATFTISGAGSLQMPVISPDGGAFTNAQTVTISNITGAAYYTTDCSNPANSSTAVLYSEPFTVYQSETVNVANRDQYGNWSAVASATFAISSSTSLQAPVISPDGGAFTNAQTVTISNANSGSIYYTTDGSNPSNSSNAVLYSEPFTVYQSETVQAASDSSAGWSAVASATFTFDSSSTIQTGSNSSQIAQLEQELETAISSNQMAQAAQILQQIQQLEAQNTNETQISNLEQQLITAINGRRKGKWARIATIMKQIAKIEASENSTATNSWAYSLLGQAYQQQGNNNINVFNGGNQINFDVQPIIINGRTLIPIRQVANAFGISNDSINWNPNGTVAINNGSSQIQFSANGQQAYLNGSPYGLDVPARIVDGRMMIPLRAIGEIFHKNVQWYPNGRIVTIQ